MPIKVVFPKKLVGPSSRTPGHKDNLELNSGFTIIVILFSNY